MRHYRPQGVTLLRVYERNAYLFKRLSNQWKRLRHLLLLGDESFNRNFSGKFLRSLTSPSFAFRLESCSLSFWKDFAQDFAHFKHLKHAALNLRDQYKSKPTHLYYKAFRLCELRHLVTLSFTPDNNSALCLPLIYYLKHLPRLKHLTLDLSSVQKESFYTLEHSRLLKCFLWIQQIPALETLKVKFPMAQSLESSLPSEKLKKLTKQLKKFYFSIGWEKASLSLTTVTRENGKLDQYELGSFFDKMSNPLCASLFKIFQSQEKFSKLTIDNIYSIIPPLTQGPLSTNLIDFFKSLTHLTIIPSIQADFSEPKEIARAFKVLFIRAFPHLEKLKALDFARAPSVTNLEEHMDSFDEFKTAIAKMNFTSLKDFQGPRIQGWTEHLFANPTFKPSRLALWTTSADIKLRTEKARIDLKNKLDEIIVDALLKKDHNYLNTLDGDDMPWENFERLASCTDYQIKNLLLKSFLTEHGLKCLILCNWPLNSLKLTLSLKTNSLFALETVLNIFSKAPWAKTLKALTINF